MEEEEIDTKHELLFHGNKNHISRMSRKVNEKIRRDRLNGLIAELAEEVPTIKYAHRRLDKSSVLRLTVSFLKLHKGLSHKKFARTNIFKDRAIYNKVNMMNNGVLMVMTQSGLILYVSQSVKQIMGYHQSDIIGFNVARFVHPEDVDNFSLCSDYPEDDKEDAFESLKKTKESKLHHNGSTNGAQRQTFYARMLKVSRLSRKRSDEEVEEDPYELMQVKTHMEQQNDNTSGDDPWVVVWVQPFVSESIKEASISISQFQKNNEWATMHSLDGKILASEHRAALFHGFMPSEIVGKMPYYFIVEDDLDIVLRSHKLIITDDDEIPSTVWRMKTVMNSLIYVESRSIIVKDKWTKLPKNIVSVNEQLSADEGEKRMACQRLRIEAAEIKKEQEQISDEDVEEPTCQSSKESSSIHIDKSDSYVDNGLKGSNRSVVRSSHIRQSIPNKTEVLEIHKCTGKPLEEIYTEEALRYHDMYKKGQSSVSSVSSVKSSCSRKRTFNDSICEEADYKSLEDSPCSQSSLESVFQSMTNTSLPQQVLPSSKSAPLEKQIGTQSSSASSKPILKGLLEGRLPLFGENIHSAGDNCLDSRTVPGYGDIGGDVVCSGARSNNRSMVNGSLRAMPTSCVGVPSHNGTSGTPDIDTIDSKGPVQSPTIGSMAVLDHMNTSDSPHQLTNQFTKQLLLKCSKVKDTFSHHVTTMSTMPAMFDNTHTVGEMTSEQRNVFRQLLGGLKSAETQLSIQNEVLVDLELEIGGSQSNNNKLCTI